VRVEGFLRAGARVAGVKAVDEETGERLTLRARHVACAVGSATDRLRDLAGGRSSRRIVPSKGIHLFVAGERLPMRTGVLARTEKSVLFIVPWQGGWLIGDTDTPWRHDGAPVANGADVDYLLTKTNALLAEPLTRADVHGTTAGLRPLVGAAGSSDTTRISRKHVVESPLPGLTTIAGGKYTTYRVMAADLVDATGLSTRPSPTRDIVLMGDPPDDPVTSADLRAGGAATPADLHAAAVRACRFEGALHLEDVLERRTRLSLTAPDRGLAAAAPAAAAMAAELGWDAARTREEVERWEALVAARHAAEAEPDDDRALAAHRAVLAERAPVAR
jgi:glycerol-3-phosphate dehydrogenase